MPLRSDYVNSKVCETRLMPARAGSERLRAERRDAIENREKILRTAADLIASRGQNVPLTEIADAAGVGVGTFYRRFPDRSALLGELQRRGYEILLDTLAAIRADGLRGADAIEAYLEQCLILANQLVALPLRGVQPLTDADAVGAKSDIVTAVENLVAEGQNDGSVRDDVSAMDVIVCGTLIATPLPYGPDWPSAAGRHLRTFVRGMRTH
jgi:AcrR family transcriptional regulator